MRKLILASIMVALATPSPPTFAQLQRYRPVSSAEPLQDRVAWLLTALDASPAARAAITAQPEVAAVRARLDATRAALVRECSVEAPRCGVEQLMLGEREIDEIAGAFERLAQTERAVQALIRAQVRPSGLYASGDTQSDAELAGRAWRETAAALNRVYRLYALGEAPDYPAIDSLDRDAKEVGHQRRLADILATGAAMPDRGFLAPWSRMAFDLLILAQRDEATRYEPLDRGLNAAANRRARSVPWQRYRYSAVLVPGNGLGANERGLSPIAFMRARLAAERWRSGVAPLIIVSGGHVHPNRTEYAEAVEMRRVLIEQFAVPAEAILTDPYARHTTTNLRNAVRLLFRAGAPMNAPFLVLSSPWQASYVAESGPDGLLERSRKELGYVPYRVDRQVSPVEVAVWPEMRALALNPREPLDP